jgi:ribonuclease P protein component
MKKGRVTHSSLFIMRHIESPGSRFSAVVPQKVGKKAVTRNAFRRKMYEAMQKLGAMHIKGVHGIVFAKSQVLTAEDAAFIEDMKDLFVKAGLLR